MFRHPLVNSCRRIHQAWVVLGAGSVVVLAASGVRSAFGVFYDRYGDYTVAFHGGQLVKEVRR